MLELDEFTESSEPDFEALFLLIVQRRLIEKARKIIQYKYWLN